MASQTQNWITSLALAALAGTALSQPAVEDELGMLMKTDPLVADLGFTFDTLGSDFDTEIAIWQLSGTLMADNDDAVPGSVLQSSLNMLLPPGVYYTSVSGYDTVLGPNFQADTDFFSEGGNVTATLNVEGGSQVINISTTIEAGNANLGEVKYYRFQIPGLFEHQDLGTVSYDGFVEIDTCGSDFDTEIGVWNLDTGEFIDFNDDASDNGGGSACDGSLQSYLSMRLPTGRYALSVSGFGTEFDEGFAAITTNDSANGSMTGMVNGVSIADAVSAGGEVEWYTFDVLALPAGALAEGEIDCPTSGTDANSCFAGGAPVPLALGQTVVGSMGGGNGVHNDVDMYEIVVTEPTLYTLSIDAEGGTAFGFVAQTVPGLPGCANLLGSASGLTAAPFQREVISGTLLPGTYYAFVSTFFGGGPTPCGSKYALSFRPQIPSCPPGSVEELEPAPFENFIALQGSTNDACYIGGDASEFVFLGDTVCGTLGNYQDSNLGLWGDQDSYRFNLVEPTVVEYEFVSTAGLLTYATTTPLPAADFCDIITAGGPGATTSPGEAGFLRLALPAGDHSFNLYASDYAVLGVASGTPYTLSINEYTCKADTNLDGIVSPADFGAWITAFNTQAPTCDQNGDDACSPADFGAWIANFNAGCP